MGWDGAVVDEDDEALVAWCCLSDVFVQGGSGGNLAREGTLSDFLEGGEDEACAG